MRDYMKKAVDTLIADLSEEDKSKIIRNSDDFIKTIKVNEPFYYVGMFATMPLLPIKHTIIKYENDNEKIIYIDSNLIHRVRYIKDYFFYGKMVVTDKLLAEELSTTLLSMFNASKEWKSYSKKRFDSFIANLGTST